MPIPENFWFCQMCGKSVIYAVRINGVIVGEECTGHVSDLDNAAPDGTVLNDRLVRVEGRWVGRYCAHCGTLCPAGVNNDGFCNECSRLHQPGCYDCGKTPAEPVVVGGVKLYAFHRAMALKYAEMDRPQVVRARRPISVGRRR